MPETRLSCPRLPCPRPSPFLRPKIFRGHPRVFLLVTLAIGSKPRGTFTRNTSYCLKTPGFSTRKISTPGFCSGASCLNHRRMALARSVYRRRKRKKKNRTERGKKKKKIVGELEKISIALRQVQRTTGCATTTLNKTIHALKEHLDVDIPERFKVSKIDNQLCHESDAHVLELNGCIGCHDHVFLPSSPLMSCPKCDHPRFNNLFKANEVSCQC